MGPSSIAAPAQEPFLGHRPHPGGVERGNVDGGAEEESELGVQEEREVGPEERVWRERHDSSHVH